LLFIAGYYSLVYFPKQRAFKKHQEYVTTLREGEEVITHSGIIGVITELDKEVGVAKVRIAEGLEVRMVAAALIQRYEPADTDEEPNSESL
jgi:preprotein translocase subunit YajC